MLGICIAPALLFLSFSTLSCFSLFCCISLHSLNAFHVFTPKMCTGGFMPCSTSHSPTMGTSDLFSNISDYAMKQQCYFQRCAWHLATRVRQHIGGMVGLCLSTHLCLHIAHAHRSGGKHIFMFVCLCSSCTPCYVHHVHACCVLTSTPNPPMLCLQGDAMQLSLWLVTSFLAAVLGMEMLEDDVCRAPNGKDGFPGIPGLDGRPGQKGDVGEPGKGEPSDAGMLWAC